MTTLGERAAADRPAYQDRDFRVVMRRARTLSAGPYSVTLRAPDVPTAVYLASARAQDEEIELHPDTPYLVDDGDTMVTVPARIRTDSDMWAWD